jgi:hypothetical protein
MWARNGAFEDALEGQVVQSVESDRSRHHDDAVTVVKHRDWVRAPAAQSVTVAWDTTVQHSNTLGERFTTR